MRQTYFASFPEIAIPSFLLEAGFSDTSWCQDGAPSVEMTLQDGSDIVVYYLPAGHECSNNPDVDAFEVVYVPTGKTWVFYDDKPTNQTLEKIKAITRGDLS